jgi:hypothetical protein
MSARVVDRGIKIPDRRRCLNAPQTAEHAAVIAARIEISKPKGKLMNLYQQIRKALADYPDINRRINRRGGPLYERYLAQRRMGLDAKLGARDNEFESNSVTAELEKLLGGNLEDRELARLRELLASDLGAEEIVELEKFAKDLTSYDLMRFQELAGILWKNVDEEPEAALDDQEEMPDGAEERIFADALSMLREKHPELSRQAIEDLRGTVRDRLRRHRSNGRDNDLPENAFEGGMGGRLSKAERAHDQRMVMDARNRRKAAEDFYKRFPGAECIGLGDPMRSVSDDSVRTFAGVAVRHRAVAMDTTGDEDFNKRFPGAARIGTV